MKFKYLIFRKKLYDYAKNPPKYVDERLISDTKKAANKVTGDTLHKTVLRYPVAGTVPINKTFRPFRVSVATDNAAGGWFVVILDATDPIDYFYLPSAGRDGYINPADKPVYVIPSGSYLEVVAYDSAAAQEYSASLEGPED